MLDFRVNEFPVDCSFQTSDLMILRYNIFNCTENKTIILSAILLAACLLLSGCGGKSAFDGSRISGETMFRMEYSILDREESAELKLREGDQIKVHISHTAGNADVIVGQEGEEPIYKGTEQENADFILTVPKTGSYRISVTGHRAKGEISFTCIPLKEK